MWNRTFRKRADGVRTPAELGQLMIEAIKTSWWSGISDKKFWIVADAIRQMVDRSNGKLKTRDAFCGVERSLSDYEGNYDFLRLIAIYAGRHGFSSLAEAFDLDRIVGARYRRPGVVMAREAIAKAAEPLLHIESGMSLADIAQVLLAADQLYTTGGLKYILAQVAAADWVIEQFQEVIEAIDFLGCIPAWARNRIITRYVFALARGGEASIRPDHGHALLSLLDQEGPAEEVADVKPVIRGMMARWSEPQPQQEAAVASTALGQ